MPTPDTRRRLFPQDRTAFVYQGEMRPILQPPQMSVVIYANATATVLADIVTPTDVPIENSTVVLNNTGLMPEFYGPVDVDTVWARPLGLTTTPHPLYPVVRKLADLSDVANGAATEGQVLAWDTELAQYVPTTVAGAVGGQQYIQATPATVWGPINHSLGYRPGGVSLFSSDFGEQFDEFVVEHLSVNSLRISMDTPAAGVAVIS
jgi:hypothetical protein